VSSCSPIMFTARRRRFLLMKHRRRNDSPNRPRLFQVQSISDRIGLAEREEVFRSRDRTATQENNPATERAKMTHYEHFDMLYHAWVKACDKSRLGKLDGRWDNREPGERCPIAEQLIAEVWGLA
jgi:hypothetical protein